MKHTLLPSELYQRSVATRKHTTYFPRIMSEITQNQLDEIVAAAEPYVIKECTSHHLACECREAALAALLNEVMLAHANPNDPDYNECDKSPCQWCQIARWLTDPRHLTSTPNQP